MHQDPQREMQRATQAAVATGPLARLGHALFRYRSFTPVPVLLLALPLLWRSRGAPHSPLWEVAGLALCVAGQALRAWVLGQVPEGTSGQGDTLMATSLNQSGPYAHTRNPLYLGNFGITLGLCLVAHQPWLALAVSVLFGVQYQAIIRVEEEFLRARFGATFDAFCARVPRFFPSLVARPAPDARPRAYDPARALRKEHNPATAWLLLALLFMGADRAAAGRSVALFLAAAAAVLLAFLCVKGWKHRWLSGNFTADLRRRLRDTRR